MPSFGSMQEPITFRPSRAELVVRNFFIDATAVLERETAEALDTDLTLLENELLVTVSAIGGDITAAELAIETVRGYERAANNTAKAIRQIADRMKDGSDVP